jgi:hypothetical protein
MSDNYNSKVDAAKRLAELRQESAEPAATRAEEGIEFEGEEDKPAFSMVSADRQRKIMVEFRMLDGNAKALAYSYMVSIDFDPSKGIGMDFSGYTVAISGRKLRPLFEGLVAQRIAVVREMDELQAEANLPDGSTVVLKIEIKSAD